MSIGLLGVIRTDLFSSLIRDGQSHIVAAHSYYFSVTFVIFENSLNSLGSAQ